MYSPQVYRIKVSSFYSSSIQVWKCNYHAIQIFHARLKVKVLKYIVNLQKATIDYCSEVYLLVFLSVSVEIQHLSKNKRKFSLFDNYSATTE